MNISEETVRVNIIKLRNKLRYTQKYLAEKLDVDVATISRIENGGIALTYKHLADIANALQVPVIDIITYPDIYKSKKSSATKVLVELDVTDDEFIRLGLKNKVLQVIDKGYCDNKGDVEPEENCTKK